MLTITFSTAAPAQAPLSPEPSAQTPPIAYLADGSRLPARLAGIDAEWKISLRHEEAIRVLPAADVVVWGAYRDVERGPQVLLSDGGVLVADVLELGARDIVIGDATGLGRVIWQSAPLRRESVRAIIYQPPADALARDRLLLDLQSAEPREDELRLVGGEVIRGFLTASAPRAPGPVEPGRELDAFQLVLKGRQEPITIPVAKVAALLFGAAAPPAEVLSSTVLFGLRDGSLVNVRSVKPGRTTVELQLAAGGTLRADLHTGDDAAPTFWDHVQLVQPRSQRVKYLSDLETLGYKQIPFAGETWPFGRGRDLRGGRLRSGGSVCLKGLAMHSASRLAYDVAGWRRLEGEVVLADAAALRGSVVFKVLLETPDGSWQPAFESPVVRGGDEPRPFSIELKDAGRAALLVEYADRGDEWDHAQWLNVRLVK